MDVSLKVHGNAAVLFRLSSVAYVVTVASKVGLNICAARLVSKIQSYVVHAVVFVGKCQ